jgi:hypothetical protein
MQPENGMTDHKEAKKVLLGQAKALGLDVDGRWAVETLAEKVLEAQEDLAERQAAAVRAASNTWVYCIRDCFLATDKHRSGSVIRVPDELYRNWKVTGAARLADQDEIAGVA